MSVDISKLSEASRTYVLKQNNNEYTPKLPEDKGDIVELSTKKNNTKKKIAIVAAILAVVGLVATAINHIKKGRPVDISKITFDKGNALAENGKAFTGTVQKLYDNGDKVLIDYKDGLIQKSKRIGENAFEKVYRRDVGNNLTVDITKNGITQTFKSANNNLDVKFDGSRVKELLEDRAGLTSSEMQAEADKIKFKSKKQIAQIEEKIKQKQDKEAAILKEKAEKEAQALKLKAEKEALLQQEKLQETVKVQETVKPQETPRPKETKITPAVAKKEPLTGELDLYAQDYVPSRTLGASMKDTVKRYPKGDYTELETLLNETKDVPLAEATRLQNYTDKPYDMPLRFMISANETASKDGAAIIVDEVPEIFKGIKQDDIADTIDRLGLVAKPGMDAHFTLDGKRFNVKHLGGGVIGSAYKISDDAGKSVAVKYFKDPSLTGLQGAYAEIPIMRQATLDGVVDTPKFYMANAAPRWVSPDGSFGGKPMGGWQMVDFVDKDTPIREGNLHFFDWLKSHGLAFGDYNSGTMTGDWVADVGGVIQPQDNYSPLFIFEGGSAMDNLLKGYFKEETAFDTLHAIKNLKS